MNYCKWFLEDYVENSERQTLSIESEDHSERSVKRDLTVLHLWRTLVTAADNTILHRKRQIVTDYDPSLWTLTYTDGKARRGSGPVSDIVDVSPMPFFLWSVGSSVHPWPCSLVSNAYNHIIHDSGLS